MSQSDDVNVNVAAETVTLPVSADVTVSTTSLDGCASSTTVNVSVPPASATETDVFDTVTPAAALLEVR